MIRNKYLLAVLLAAAPLATHAVETVYTFDRITRIEHRESEVRVTGILVNDTTPTTVMFPLNTGQSERCEKLLNVVLSQPAAYTVMLVTDLVQNYPTDYLSLSRCSAEFK